MSLNHLTYQTTWHFRKSIMPLWGVLLTHGQTWNSRNRPVYLASFTDPTSFGCARHITNHLDLSENAGSYIARWALYN